MVKKQSKTDDWRRRPRPWARKAAEERRSESIEIRVTLAERDAMHEAAERMGISLAELCRQAFAAIIGTRRR